MALRGGMAAELGSLARTICRLVLNGQPVRVHFLVQRCLVHQAANGEMHQSQRIELLAHQIRGFTAQHDLRSPQVRLHFTQRAFDLPALAVKLRHLLRAG